MSLFQPPDSGDADAGLDAVESWFRSTPGCGPLFGACIRQAIDEVLDGERTGRYDIAQLSKNEKIYIGTRVEIVIEAAFDLSRGGIKGMDYLIVGEQVDCKWSMGFGGWMIPREAVGQLCLVTWADDYRGVFSVGLIRATEDRLRTTRNQDAKRNLNPEGKAAIRWLFRDAELPENLLLRVGEDVRTAIFAHASGQKRVNELFRLVQRRLIRRPVVCAVAQQLDSAKRVRDARLALAPEGIMILGHQDGGPATARRIGLPVPVKGEWVSYAA